MTATEQHQAALDLIADLHRAHLTDVLLGLWDRDES